MSRLLDALDVAIILGGVSWGWAFIIERIEGATALLTAIGILILTVLRIIYWTRRLRDERESEDPSNL